MGTMTQAKVYENEIAKSGDFQHISDSSLTNLYRLILGAFGPTKNIIFQGGNVVQRTPASMNVDVEPLFGFNVADGTLIFSDTATGPIAVEAANTSDRYDTVQVRLFKTFYDRQQRKFKDPATGAQSYQDVDTKYRIEVEVQIKKGTAGSGNAPAVDAGWVKLAEILVAANQTSITNAAIRNCTATIPTENSTSWTTNQGVTFRLKTMEDLKKAFRAGHKEDGSHADDSVGNNAINFGLGANQVNAGAVPIADGGGYLSANTVEAALQELAHWVDAQGVVGAAGGDYTLKVALDSLAAQIASIGGGSPPVLTAVDTILQNQVIAKTSSGNQVRVGDKRDGAKVEIIGFAAANRSPGQSVLLKTSGYMGGFTGLIPGNPLFLGNNGAIVQADSDIAIGEWRVYLGMAISEDTIIVSIEEPSRKITNTSAYTEGVGLEFAWPGTSGNVPFGYMWENAAAVSRETYPELNALAAAAGYNAPWGPGNGTTTFNIPNKPGFVIRYLPFIQTTVEVTENIIGGGGAADGAVGINFDNRQIESDLAGYVTYADAAGATPVDGTGGTPNVSLAHNIASPLFGVGDAIFSKGSANRQGQGFSFDFTIDPGLAGETLELSFYYKASTNYASGDLGVFLFDKTNNNLIPISNVELPKTYGGGSVKYVGSAYLTNSLQYRVIVHVRTTSALAWTFEFDNVQFAVKRPAYGAAIGPSEQWTPVLSTGALGTTSDNKATKQIIGEDLKLDWRFKQTGAGTIGSGPYLIALPDNYTVDLNKKPIGSVVGVAKLSNNANEGGTSTTIGQIVIESATQLRVYSLNAIGTLDTWGSSHFALSAANTSLSFTALIPVSQRTGSGVVQMAENAGTLYLSNTESVANTNGVVGKSYYGIEGAPIVSNTAATYYDITLPRALQPDEVPVAEVRSKVNGIWIPVEVAGVDSLAIAKLAGDSQLKDPTDSANSYYAGGFNLFNVSSGVLRMRVGQRAAQSGNNTWATSSITNRTWAQVTAAADGYDRWRVRIEKAGVRQETPTVYAEATGTSLTNGVCQFNTIIEDTHGRITTGAGWRFTILQPGRYEVNVFADAPGATGTVIARKNGVDYQNLFGMPTVPWAYSGIVTIKGVSGDYIDIRSTVGTSTNIRIQITRIGA